MATIAIRFAAPEDAPILLRLIRDLAAFERAPGRVVATEDDLVRHGFGAERRFEALLAFLDGRPVGFALFFPSFSTWLGRPGLYLEDIFVAEAARKLGVGRRLMARLARIAVERRWARLDLAVLHWNPARDFYRRIGIDPLTEWVPYRVEGEALARLAREAEGE